MRKENNTSTLADLGSPNQIAILISVILQPAMAGGLPEEKAEIIYNTIMQNISSLHPSGNQFNTLLNDIINKWSMPIINKFGVNTPDILSNYDNLN